MQRYHACIKDFVLFILQALKKKPLEAFIKGKAWLNLLQNLKEHSP